MAEKVMMFLRSAAAAVIGTPARTPAGEVTRRNQLALVSLLTDDPEPNAEMRAMAAEYRDEVVKGRIVSVR